MPTSDARYAVPRRTALVTTLAVAPLALGTTGCRWTPPWQDEDEPVVVDAVEGDSVLVAGVVERIQAARAQALTLRGTTPAATGLAKEWVALHDTHLAALGGTVTPSDTVSPTDAGSTPPAKVTKPTSLARLRSTEVALNKALTARAVEAESGQLAQSLASMAAAIAQLLTASVKVTR